MSVVQRKSHSAWYAIITIIIECGFYWQINIKYLSDWWMERQTKETNSICFNFLIVFAFTSSYT